MVTKDGIVPVKGGQYKLLSDDQIQDLHNAAIDVLHDVGIKIMHQQWFIENWQDDILFP